MTSKDIHIGDVMSAHSGRIIGPNNMKGVWEVAFHMLSPEIGPAGLRVFADKMKQDVQDQHPWLADINYTEADIAIVEDAERFWRVYAEEHGEFLTLEGPDHDR